MKRTACRARGYANNSNCSPRNLNANNAVTNANRNYGGSAQTGTMKLREPLRRVLE
nr:MAG TPA: hypothetical protein [Caudoviricetes sp.]